MDDKRAEAVNIAQEQQRLTAEAERLNEANKAAEEEFDGLTAEVSQIAARVAIQDEAVNALGHSVGRLAIETFVFGDRSGTVADLIAVLSSNTSEGPLRELYLDVLLGTNSDEIDMLRSARQDTQRLLADLGAKQKKQAAVQKRIVANQASLAAAQHDLDVLGGRIDDELVAMVAEEVDRLRQAMIKMERAVSERAAASTPSAVGSTVRRPASIKPAQAGTASSAKPRVAAQTTVEPDVSTSVARTPTGPSQTAALTVATTRPPLVTAAKPTVTTPKPTVAPRPTIAPPPDYPAPSPGAAVAVAAAKSQLGKPYVFGTNGPSTFDCSGLTQWAWAKAGVSMSHYTVSQFNEFPHVPLNALQPGDLVFFKIDLGHMGMYLGGGLIIHAPQSGDVVKIGRLADQNVVGAARPG